jgi:hypothetical protein
LKQKSPVKTPDIVPWVTEVALVFFFSYRFLCAFVWTISCSIFYFDDPLFRVSNLPFITSSE